MDVYGTQTYRHTLDKCRTHPNMCQTFFLYIFHWDMLGHIGDLLDATFEYQTSVAVSKLQLVRVNGYLFSEINNFPIPF